MAGDYALEKWLWTDADFERMGWHDARIHAIAFLPERFEFALDIDYIFRWVQPTGDDVYFSFWVAPATLVFEIVHSLEFDLEGGGELDINAITRGDPQAPPSNAEYIGPRPHWQWIVECHQGEIRFRSVGFKQYIRSAPRLSREQVLDTTARGGFSFARGGGDRPHQVG